MGLDGRLVCRKGAKRMGKLKQKNRGFRMLCAELVKLRRTWILWLHIIMPLTGIVIFLLYYRISGWSSWGKISGYVEVVSVVCPTLVGFICGLAADQEKQAGHFQNLLGTGQRRTANLSAKLCTLLLWNLAAVLVTIVGFGAGYYLFIERTAVPEMFYITVTGLIWISQIFTYCLHLFLGLRFSKGISIGAGIVESLLAAILMTGLGDGIWQWIPCAWVGRFTGLYVQRAAGMDSAAWALAESQMKTGGIMMAGITIAGILLTYLWFHYYEGKRMED